MSDHGSPAADLRERVVQFDQNEEAAARILAANPDELSSGAPEAGQPPAYGGAQARRSHAAGSRPGEVGPSSVMDEPGSRSRSRSRSSSRSRSRSPAAVDGGLFYKDAHNLVVGPFPTSQLASSARSTTSAITFNLRVSYDSSFEHVASLQDVVNGSFGPRDRRANDYDRRRSSGRKNKRFSNGRGRKRKKNKKKRALSPSSSSSSDSSDSDSSSSSDTARVPKRSKSKPKAAHLPDDISIKTSREPPSAAEQRAIAAAAASQPVPVSLAETQLRQAKPPASASDDAKMLFQFQMMQCQKDNPVVVAYPYSGKLILHSSQLAPATPKPVGMPSWLAALSTAYFRVDDTKSMMSAARDASKGHVFTIGAASFTSAATSTASVPALPTTAGEFYVFAERLLNFAVASNRWTTHEAEMARVHQRHVMTLFAHYPAADVLLYDENFRYHRHLYQDGAWSTPDADLFASAISLPAQRRVDSKPPAARRESTDRKKTEKADKKGASKPNRPYLKSLSFENKDICRAYQWATNACTDDICVISDNLVHVCSYCLDTHRAKDCDLYQSEQAADFNKGPPTKKKRN